MTPLKMPVLAAVVAVLVAAVMVAAIAGCGDSSKKPRQKAPKTAASASPSSPPPSSGTSGKSWTLNSGSQTYDAQLGGIYQAVGLEAFGSGAVRVAWVAGGDAAGASPQTRLKAGPGVLDVWLSDVRPHADLMTPLGVPRGPVESVAFVAPADDSLLIVRLTMRDSSVTPKASVEVTGGDAGAGEIVVVLH